jgi:hypothetical protein
MTAQLQYHQATFDLLKLQPVFSATSAHVVRGCEDYCDFKFPASVREWYSLEGAVDILRTYPNQDHPIPLNLLGDEVDALDDYHKLLIFMHENQGVCSWAVRIGTGDDPPVYVRYEQDDPWRLYAESFSGFVYIQVWDWHYRLQVNARFGAAHSPLSENELKVLGEYFCGAAKKLDRIKPGLREYSALQAPLPQTPLV